MATQVERIATLETKMTHLVEMIAEHREESRQAAASAKFDRNVMQAELSALTNLATTGKAKLSVLWWLAGISGSAGAGLAFTLKYLVGYVPKL